MVEILGATASGIAQKLRQDILNGEFSAGDRLPTERDLAMSFGVARNTVRSALDHLHSQGIVSREVGRGTFVRTDKGLSPLGDNAGRGLHDASPADIMEVRLIIEPHVAAMAATRANRGDLDAISAALDGSLAAKEFAEFERWDTELHMAIFKAAKNQVLFRYCLEINAVRQTKAWLRLKQRSLNPARQQAYHKQHQDLVDAIRSRDPDLARQLSLQHAESVQSNLISV